MTSARLLNLLTLVFVASFTMLQAQQPRTTGGNHLWAGITSITPCNITSTICTLTKGQSYSVEIEAESEFNSEETFYLIAAGWGQVGKLENIKPSDAHSIPVNNLPRQGGMQTLTLFVHKLSLVAYDMVQVYVMPNVGTPIVEKGNGFIIFPNPATDVVKISAGGTISNVSITNVFGQVVFSSKYNAEEIEIDVKQLPAGTYYMSLQGEDGVVTKRFMRVE